jgi:DNA repair exonuclease SbcCD ATPase subunit
MSEEYLTGLKELQAKEKETIIRYQAARNEYFKVEKELDEVRREIEGYKERHGVFQNVR